MSDDTINIGVGDEAFERELAPVEGESATGAGAPATATDEERAANPLARFPVPVLPDKPPAEWRYRRAFEFGASIKALWRSGAIIWGLIVRQLRSTYSQQVFGLAWTVLTPLAQMGIFTILLRRANSTSKKQLIHTHGVPGAVWVYVGLLLWGFYSGAVSTAGTSLVGNPLLNKVYAPREVFPIAQVATSGFDAIVSTLILPILLFVTMTGLTWSTLWAAALPVAALVLYATGIGLFVSGLTVYARDLRSGLPIIMSLGLFMPGVLYGVNDAWTSVKVQSVYAAIFPVGQLCDSARRAVLIGDLPGGLPFWIAIVASAIYFLICFSVFKRMETGFADVS